MVLRTTALIGAVIVSLAFVVPGPRTISHPPVPRIDWRPSRSLGFPWNGRLVNGVQLPATGRLFATWDPALNRSPNRPWRRWGSDRLVRTVLRVVHTYHRTHPHAPKVLIGDLSRPHGGPFGPEYGGLGHVSHQNGLDVDVYYPRKDGSLRPPVAPRQIDRRLAQGLLNRFIRAGARTIFVGPNTRLTGPRRIVHTLLHHDNHMHVRIAARPTRTVIGYSLRGRPLVAYERGNRSAPPTLVVGAIHGNEPAGSRVIRLLRRVRLPHRVHLWLLPSINPDGLAAHTRQNARGVDLNRNWPAGWRHHGQPWDGYYSGPRPASEPETRAGLAFIRKIRPRLTIWFHQPLTLVWGSDPHVATLRRYARMTGLPYRRRPAPRGAATRWQRRHFPHTTAFVVELPPGPLSARESRRHAAAVVRLAK